MTTIYKPYSSDSEPDSGSESDTSFSSDTTSSSYATLVTPDPPRNFRALADGLSLSRIGAVGPEVKSPRIGWEITNGFATFTKGLIPADPSGNEIKSASQDVTSIIMLDSTDRDRNVFVQPTNVTLRLPREYRNIASFQLVQIKLLSAFFYFRADKNNLDVSVLELGRTKLVRADRTRYSQIFDTRGYV